MCNDLPFDLVVSGLRNNFLGDEIGLRAVGTAGDDFLSIDGPDTGEGIEIRGAGGIDVEQTSLFRAGAFSACVFSGGRGGVGLGRGGSLSNGESDGGGEYEQPAGEFHTGDSSSEMSAAELLAKDGAAPSHFFHGTSKPYVRWWWLAGPFTREDIARQLRWVREAGFGGVELAWIFPSWTEEQDEAALKPEWLSTDSTLR